MKSYKELKEIAKGIFGNLKIYRAEEIADITGEVYQINRLLFAEKAQYDKALEIWNEHKKEIKENMQDQDWLVAAFIVEMQNYECQFYDDKEKVFSCFGIVEPTQRQETCYKIARKQFWDMCLENNWF